MKKDHGTNEQRQGGPVVSVCFRQVHSGASSTASAPTGTLFVGRAVPAVSRPPAVVVEKKSDSEPLGTGVDTHTHTHTHRGGVYAPQIRGGGSAYVCVWGGGRNCTLHFGTTPPVLI